MPDRHPRTQEHAELDRQIRRRRMAMSGLAIGAAMGAILMTTQVRQCGPTGDFARACSVTPSHNLAHGGIYSTYAAPDDSYGTIRCVDTLLIKWDDLTPEQFAIYADREPYGAELTDWCTESEMQPCGNGDPNCQTAVCLQTTQMGYPLYDEWCHEMCIDHGGVQTYQAPNWCLCADRRKWDTYPRTNSRSRDFEYYDEMSCHFGRDPEPHWHFEMTPTPAARLDDGTWIIHADAFVCAEEMVA